MMGSEFFFLDTTEVLKKKSRRRFAKMTSAEMLNQPKLGLSSLLNLFFDNQVKNLKDNNIYT